ncbi:S-layer homology domain-containing protein [Candidatus Spongiisocius sp.]|uniref:S-layer homology domain-containing protein n=1 Tax=Candidatus Spongiisocius sp. TaxID=3101273 RepID=UPI003B597E3B
MLLVLVPASTLLAQTTTRFSDVPEDNDQYTDIEYAAERGWFQGYDDGTFRPDHTISGKNALKVFNRAFPKGVSRADLATILRVGFQRLAVVDDETFRGCHETSYVVELGSAWQALSNNPGQVICYLLIEEQVRNGQVWVIVRVETLMDCRRGWEVELRLTTPGGLPSSTAGRGYSASAWVGDILTVEVQSNMDRWEGIWLESECLQPW